MRKTEPTCGMSCVISKFLGVPDHVSSYFPSTPYTPLLYYEFCDTPFSSDRGSTVVLSLGMQASVYCVTSTWALRLVFIRQQHRYGIVVVILTLPDPADIHVNVLSTAYHEHWPQHPPPSRLLCLRVPTLGDRGEYHNYPLSIRMARKTQFPNPLSSSSTMTRKRAR